MEGKQADNKILDNKAKVKEIDSKIDIEKNKENNLDDIEEVVNSLNSNINKCIELLGISIKGNNTERKLSALEIENRINYKKSMNDIEAQRQLLKSNITKLNDEKEEALNNIKEEENK